MSGQLGEVDSTSSRTSPPAKAFPGKCCDTPAARYCGPVGHSVVGIDCERPFWIGCLACGAAKKSCCGSSQSRVCVPCARRYRNRVRSVIHDGLEYVPPGLAMMLTVTAPSDRGSHCRRHARCDGIGRECDLCPCTPPGGIDLAEWNSTYTARFNRVLEAIRRGEASPPRVGLRRRVKVEYFHGREVQKRGALHGHLVLLDIEQEGVHLDRGLLRQLLIHHGFGHEFELARIGTSKHQGSKSRTAGRVAGYVAKYVSKAADARETVPWPAMPRRRQAPYRTWTRSRGWPSSMKEVRARQVAWAIARSKGLILGLRGWSTPLVLAEAARASFGAPLDPNTEYYAAVVRAYRELGFPAPAGNGSAG